MWNIELLLLLLLDEREDELSIVAITAIVRTTYVHTGRAVNLVRITYTRDVYGYACDTAN